MTYQTSTARVFLAIIVGAGVGGLVSAVVFFFPDISRAGLGNFWKNGLRYFPLALSIGIISWLIGIVVLGCPLWYWLHNRKRRSWPMAVVVGAVAPAAFVMFILSGYFAGRTPGRCIPDGDGRMKCTPDKVLSLQDWMDSFAFSALFGVIGALVGIAIWFVAYRKTPVATNN